MNEAHSFLGFKQIDVSVWPYFAYFFLRTCASWFFVAVTYNYAYISWLSRYVEFFLGVNFLYQGNTIANSAKKELYMYI